MKIRLSFSVIDCDTSSHNGDITVVAMGLTSFRVWSDMEGFRHYRVISGFIVTAIDAPLTFESVDGLTGMNSRCPLARAYHCWKPKKRPHLSGDSAVDPGSKKLLTKGWVLAARACREQQGRLGQ